MRASVPTISRWLSFLRPNVHEEVLPLGIFAIQTLDRILHSSGELTVSSTKLLQKHIAKSGVRSIDADRVHEFFYVVIHSGFAHWTYLG